MQSGHYYQVATTIYYFQSRNYDNEPKNVDNS